MRSTYAVIDLDAIRHNVRAIGDVLGDTGYCAVVKADGYGHGDAPVAMAAMDAGATRLAVALVEEGIRLREADIDAPILVLSEPDSRFAAEIVKWNLTPSVYSGEFVEALAAAGLQTGVHIKVDTGMHRVGVPSDQFLGFFADVVHSGIEIEGVFTHFPVADSDPAFTERQIEHFDDLVAGLDVEQVHMANTPAALLHPASNRTFSRIGLGTYGLHPTDATREVVELHPAMSIVSHVSHVQQLEAGARLSYGRIRPLSADARVVTVPIGYADGYPRLLTRNGEALIGGARFPLAGMVTMDQTMIVVGDADVGVGDEVVLLGAQGEQEISADDWANELDTISYEIVCSIGPRVPRRYSS